MVYAEDERVLDSILGTCMLRVAEGVRMNVVFPVSEYIFNKYLPINIPEKLYDKASCEADRCNCNRFKLRECIGCPASKCYIGWFRV